jgi:ABC-type glycerol-3-phosphate transport system substrate-binding protein
MSMRRVAAAATLGLLLGACAGSNPLATPDPQPSAGTAAPAAGGAPSTTVTTTAPATTAGGSDSRPAPDPNRPPAPDFELTLGSGGVFALSAETRPVFLVFWAEW